MCIACPFPSFQGLHTKMVQVCSKCLSIPDGNIYLKETSVDTVPNATPTIASMSADLNGMAVKVICVHTLECLSIKLKLFEH